jgi:hypothetical protein
MATPGASHGLAPPMEQCKVNPTGLNIIPTESKSQVDYQEHKKSPKIDPW